MNQGIPSSIEDERKRINANFRITGAIAVFVLVFGAVFYHIVEKLEWLDSFYFCVITLTTIGYGDITPHTDLGKLFTIFYVLIGIGIIGTFANLLIKRASMRHEEKRESKYK